MFWPWKCPGLFYALKSAKFKIVIFVYMLPEELIAKAARELSNKLKPAFIKSTKEQTGDMLDLNENQLDRGILNTGASITPSYSANYARKKGRRIPDLKVTGDYRKSLFVDVLPDKLEFGATDFKDPFLTDRYSQDIKGLTEENADKVFTKVMQPVDKLVNDVTKKYI